MNSSTGFKKRNLLRPPSGIISHHRELLKVIDITQSEPIVASNIRTEVAAIQEQINLLDKDKVIRTGEASLEKSYVLNLRKWLKEVQVISDKEQEDGKILKAMGVDNHEAGFRKLWKFLSHLDLMVSKITELQCVQFLKYDELFGNIAEHSANAERILQAISKGGFNPSNFYLSQLLLERQMELFSVNSALKRQSSSNTANSSKGFNKLKQNSDDLIEQLRTENAKLVQLLDDLQQSQKKEEQRQKIKSEHSIRSNDPRDAFTQVQEKYKEQIQDLNSKIHKLNNQLGELRIHCDQIQARLKAAEDQLKSQQYQPTEKPKGGSFQEALMEEMNKMKAGFEKKIRTILDQFSQKEREARKREHEYKTENEKIKWQKGLLLKKYQLLSSA